MAAVIDSVTKKKETVAYASKLLNGRFNSLPVQ